MSFVPTQQAATALSRLRIDQPQVLLMMQEHKPLHDAASSPCTLQKSHSAKKTDINRAFKRATITQQLWQSPL
jgi:hypothetical protein